MKLSRVTLYLVILLALAAYVYFVEIRHKRDQEARKAEADKILKLDKEKITLVILKSKKHGPIGLKKTGDTWVLTEPVTVRADESAVRSLLNSISDAQFDKVLKDKDVKWGDYGLNQPEFSVSVRTRDHSYDLFFGAPNPAKTSYYLRAKGDPRLMLVADTLKNALDKSTFDLRDKTVFALAPEDINRFVVTRGGTETEFRRHSPDKWEMLKPEHIRVKAAEVNRELVNLTNLQAMEIIDKPTKQGDPYGLDKPSEKIQLLGKKRSQTLLVGNAKKTQGRPSQPVPDRYARIAGLDMVYLISGRALARIRTDPKDLQDKFLLHFSPNEIDKLEVNLDGKKWLIVRSGERKWMLEKPEKKEEVETWPITGILWDLKNLEWKEVTRPAPPDLASVGLHKPRLLVSLWKKGEKEPMTLKAGWQDVRAKERVPDSGKTPLTPSGTEPGKPPADAKADGKTDEPQQSTAKPLQDDLPETVNVLPRPCDVKDAIYTADSTFIQRLRKELKGLTETGK